MRSTFRFIYLFCCILSAVPLKGLAADKVVYPQPEEAHRYHVYIEILQAALEASKDRFGEYEMHASEDTMSETRRMQELGKNTGMISVGWSGPTFIDVGSLHAIQIPLLKGLLSYRLLIAQKDKVNSFSDCHLECLQRKTTAHAHGWGTLLLFEEYDLLGHTTSYRSLYNLLEIGRVDYISRGLTEVYDELNTAGRSHYLDVVPDMMLYFPWPYFFYVHRENQRMNKRLTYGLEKIIKNGVHEDIVNKYASGYLQNAKLASRRVIRLSNPWVADEEWPEICKNCIHLSNTVGDKTPNKQTALK